jgi:hypothetical protein
MPNSCFSQSLNQPQPELPNRPDQLTVTRRCAERTRPHPLNEWEFSNSGFNGQKRSKMNAIAIGTMAREIWPRVGLVNGAKTSRDSIIRR